VFEAAIRVLSLILLLFRINSPVNLYLPFSGLTQIIRETDFLSFFAEQFADLFAFVETDWWNVPPERLFPPTRSVCL